MKAVKDDYKTLIKYTYKNVLPIIEELKNSQACSKCENYSTNLECSFSPKPNKDYLNLINKVNLQISNFKRKLSRIEYDGINANRLFNLLYSINIPSVDDFLNEYNYNKQIENQLKKVLPKMINNEELSNFELHFLNNL